MVVHVAKHMNGLYSLYDQCVPNRFLVNRGIALHFEYPSDIKAFNGFLYPFHPLSNYTKSLLSQHCTVETWSAQEMFRV